jgi:hypothetical protein
MLNSVEVTIESDDCVTYDFEIEFEATKGHISYDYFEPSEPDEVEIINIRSHGYKVSNSFANLLCETYNDHFEDKIWEYLYKGDY